MYRYRVKVPTFFLGVLLFIAFVGFVGSLRTRSKAQRIGSIQKTEETAAAFDARIAAISDPAKLRSLAAREHQRVVAGDQLIASMMSFFRSTLGRSLPIQAGLVLLCVLIYYLFEYRTPPR